MSSQAKPSPGLSTNATRRSLSHLFGEYERARAERDAADARMARFTETILLLLDSLPAVDRDGLAARFNEIRTGAAVHRGGELFGNVISLFRDDRRRQWSMPAIQAALQERGAAPPDSKSLYNAIAYLAKTGRLQRVARGHYVVAGLGAGIEIEGFDDGTSRATEHDNP